MSFNGMVLAIGDEGDINHGGLESGSVTIYNRATIKDQFIEIQTLWGKNDGSLFGISIDMDDSGLLLIVAAPFETAVIGSLYLFVRYDASKTFKEIYKVNGDPDRYPGVTGVAIETRNDFIFIHESDDISYDAAAPQTYKLLCDCRNPNLVCNGFDSFPHLMCIALPTAFPTASRVPSTIPTVSNFPSNFQSFSPSLHPSTSKNPSASFVPSASLVPSTISAFPSVSSFPSIITFSPSTYPSTSNIPSVSLVPSISPIPSSSPSTSMSPTAAFLDLVVNLFTDLFGAQTSWEVIGEDGEVVLKSNIEYESFVTYTETHPLSSKVCYEFIIYDSAGNGICCRGRDGSFSIIYDG
eukprot:CAMPEP_0194424598 /NCGR_PEP_ID=MMETSP0176-20130528/23881_1 /TAXON_ID=216777 /ORGANISM="Proboscia alata, Strain PI-D3" /LENGTH=352 /DNA_ID=CAMNT_0039234463 /DNA_START=186 /DNA_END=1240 /DNA_ORIENTATION=-